MKNTKTEKFTNGFKNIIGLVIVHFAGNGGKIITLGTSCIIAVLSLLNLFLLRMLPGKPFDIIGFFMTLFIGANLILTVLVAYIYGSKRKEVSEENIKLNRENMLLGMTIEWVRTEAEYRVKIAALGGKVPEALKATFDWNLTNDTIKPETENDKRTD